MTHHAQNPASPHPQTARAAACDTRGCDEASAGLHGDDGGMQLRLHSGGPSPTGGGTWEGAAGICYVETMNLDGETALKPRRPAAGVWPRWRRQHPAASIGKSGRPAAAGGGTPTPFWPRHATSSGNRSTESGVSATSLAAVRQAANGAGSWTAPTRASTPLLQPQQSSRHMRKRAHLEKHTATRPASSWRVTCDGPNADIHAFHGLLEEVGSDEEGPTTKVVPPPPLRLPPPISACRASVYTDMHRNRCSSKCICSSICQPPLPPSYLPSCGSRVRIFTISIHTLSHPLHVYCPCPLLCCIKVAVDIANVLLRGSVLRNTPAVIGVVVYTGRDTKVHVFIWHSLHGGILHGCAWRKVCCAFGLVLIPGLFTRFYAGDAQSVGRPDKNQLPGARDEPRGM